MPFRRLRSRTHRLICSRFPTIGVFDDIAADEEELRVAFQLEGMTNGRLQPVQRLQAIPEGGIAAGPTASIAMAAFIHCSDRGSRFNDGRLGAWYASTDIDTAISETVFHHERRLRMSEGGFPNRIQIRELVLDMDMEFFDLCGLVAERPELYDPDDYSRSQAFSREHRWPFAREAIDGLVYDSVRRAGGTNICVFRPTALPLPIVQGRHYEYVWDAQEKLNVLLLENVPFER